MGLQLQQHVASGKWKFEFDPSFSFGCPTYSIQFVFAAHLFSLEMGRVRSQSSFLLAW